jgi:hypothetical protein
MRVITQCKNRNLLFMFSTIIDPSILGRIACLIPEQEATFLVPYMRAGGKEYVPNLAAAIPTVPADGPSMVVKHLKPDTKASSRISPPTIDASYKTCVVPCDEEETP